MTLFHITVFLIVVLLRDTLAIGPGVALPRYSVKVDSMDALYPSTDDVVQALDFRGLKAMGLGIGPLDTVTVFDAGDHWHLVTTGLADRFGFELTFRLTKGDDDGGGDAPAYMFAVNMLQNLAQYVFETGNSLLTGDHINTNGPINTDLPDTKMRAVCFACDGWVDGNELRQVVALTLDELGALNAWFVSKFCDLMREEVSPLLICDLRRNSILDDPIIEAKVREASIRDGSTTELLFVDNLKVSETGFSIGDHGLGSFSRVLPARLCHDQVLKLQWENTFATIEPGEENSIRMEAKNENYEHVVITMTSDMAKQVGETLASAKSGTYTWDGFDAFEIKVNAVEITPAIDMEKAMKQAEDLFNKSSED